MKQRLLQAAIGALSAAVVSFVGAILGADPTSVVAASTPVGAAAATQAEAIAGFITSAVSGN